MTEFAPIIWVSICGIPGFILWLIMLSILDSKEGNAYYFVVTLKQYKRFYRIIIAEKQKSKRQKYLILFWAQIAIIVIYLLGAMLII